MNTNRLSSGTRGAAASRRVAASTRLIAIAIAVGVAPLVLLTGGCNRTTAKAEAKGPPAVPVDVAAARTEPVQRTVEVVGTLFGEEDATISNKVNGKIIAIY
jgi:multidrug efflux pump subunit AcrA (membrane-fusion protein)